MNTPAIRIPLSIQRVLPKLLLLFLVAQLISACKKAEKEPIEPIETIILCDLSQRRAIQEVYEFVEGRQTNSSNPEILFSDQSCVDSLCSFFRLDLSNPPDYTLDFLLYANSDSVILDTLRGSEKGTYSLGYCETVIPPGFVEGTKRGQLQFFPLSKTAYYLTFNQKNDVFSILDFEFDGRVIELTF